MLSQKYCDFRIQYLFNHSRCEIWEIVRQCNISQRGLNNNADDSELISGNQDLTWLRIVTFNQWTNCAEMVAQYTSWILDNYRRLLNKPRSNDLRKKRSYLRSFQAVIIIVRWSVSVIIAKSFRTSGTKWTSAGFGKSQIYIGRKRWVIDC